MSDGPLTGEAMPINGSRLNVEQCAACDGRHDGLDIHEYQRKPHPFTHYYQCPTLGDPVPVALAMMRGGEALELTGPVCQAIAEAQLCGRWVFVVGYYDHDSRLRVRKTSHKFPVVDYFETAEHRNFLGTLKDMLEQECGMQQPAVMRQATMPKPLVDLLGNGAKRDVEKFKIALPHTNGADADQPAG